MDALYKKKTAYRVSILSIIANVFLSVIKIVIGFIAHSAVLISDGIHSVSDVFSTFLVLFGIELASREADASHRYGHERIECVIGIYLSAFLAMVGFFIGYEGAVKLITGAEIAVPSRIALYVALVSIVTKEVMYQITNYYGKKISSSAMIADAWHHRSDALSSVGSFIGILFALKGYPFMDPVLSIVICLFIMKAAWEIGMSSVDKLVDKSLSEEEEHEIIDAILGVKGVMDINDLKTRQFADKKYIDVVICVKDELSVVQGHDIATEVHDMVEERFENVKHCMVHVDPV